MQLAQPEVHLVEVVHGEHTYLLFWTKETLAQAVRVPGRQAVDPQLNFDLYDGLKLATAIRDTSHGCSKQTSDTNARTTR
jgi:uncharacterized membrane protein